MKMMVRLRQRRMVCDDSANWTITATQNPSVCTINNDRGGRNTEDDRGLESGISCHWRLGFSYILHHFTKEDV